eukprot:CAMPEP_0185787924 /NCGR_PEP_ID=MMETSP1174-20130828/143396_1 /TAXON_ID=35687 /ORGANISM="Dictyocha speculum, Strain CCMP1381" /LENGTH=152 /DNA_ID=CAMNT_0028481327 /DNA_START=31 /DNA_END=486 /DNA_ORIENTATION=-
MSEQINQTSLHGRISAAYFLLFTAKGFVYPFLPLFLYKYAGLSKTQIGGFALLQQLMTSCTSPVLGHLADVYKAHGRILLAGIVASAVALVALLPAARVHSEAFRYICLLFVNAVAFGVSGWTPVLDSFSLYALGSIDNYGRARLWGAVGFG